jgi:hypothetical protein
MSNSKHKYDWDNYLPKMISLYLTGMSIPEIWRAIQDESTRFTPGYVDSRIIWKVKLCNAVLN